MSAYLSLVPIHFANVVGVTVIMSIVTESMRGQLFTWFIETISLAKMMGWS